MSQTGARSKSPNAIERILRRARSLSAGSRAEHDRGRSRGRLVDPPVRNQDIMDLVHHLNDGDDDFEGGYISDDFINPQPPPPVASAPPQPPLNPIINVSHAGPPPQQNISAPPVNVANNNRDELLQHLIAKDAERDLLLKQTVEKLGLVNSKINSLELRSQEELDPMARPAIMPPPFAKPQDHYDGDNVIRKSILYAKAFQHVPTFKGESTYSVREFLESMNSCIIDNLFKMTEKVFVSILLSKLAISVRMGICGGGGSIEKSCLQLYNSLLSLYDFAETEQSATVKLLQLKAGPKITNFSEFFEGAMKLLRLSGGTPSDKSKHFLIALYNILPDRIREKIEEKVYNYRKRSNNKEYPSIEWILNNLTCHRDEIDKSLSDQQKKLTVPKVKQVATSKNETKSNQQIPKI